MEIGLKKVLTLFPRQNVLVIGDFILDTYIRGSSKRISQEAPVPVVDVDEIKDHLGGAANVAFNLKSLSAKVIFCTVVGHDEAGRKGMALMERAGLSTAGAFVSATKCTQAKTRVMAGDQAVVRYDSGDVQPLDNDAEKKVIAFIRSAYDQCDAVLIADYEKGMITPGIINCLLQLRKKKRGFIAVDSRRLEFFKVLQPDLVKPNFEEARKLLPSDCFSAGDRIKDLRKMGSWLTKCTNAAIIALTLDKDGTLWFKDGSFKLHSPSQYVASAQVNGAGDTFISTALLSLLSGASFQEAGKIATDAALIVIRKQGTAACTLDELGVHLQTSKKITDLGDILPLIRQFQLSGRKIVFTNGCFDILHNGHIHFLKKAKALGDILVVGLNADESVKRLKGEGRPINCLNDRIDVLSAIGCVDYIIPFGTPGNDTAIHIIKTLHPDLFVKGENFKDKELVESPVLISLGIPVSFLQADSQYSTSALIQRIQEKGMFNRAGKSINNERMDRL